MFDKIMKNKRIIFLFIKISLSILIGFILYKQLQKIDFNDLNQIKIHSISYLIFAFLLIPINWGIEFIKWKITVNKIIQPKTSISLINSFFAGLVTGTITPNMLGNFVGRLYYFKRSYRPLIILTTFFTNYTQFFASMFFGAVSILILNKSAIGELGLTIKALICFTLFFLFLIGLFFEKFPIYKFQKYTSLKILKERLKTFKHYKVSIFILSLTRHFIFSIQFLFLIKSLSCHFEFHNILWIWQIYFWTTLIPSLWFGKLFIRESVALVILTSVGLNEITVLISSISLWIMNLGLPSILAIGITNMNKK